MNTIGLYNSLANTNQTLGQKNEQVTDVSKVAKVNDVSQDKASEAGAGESLKLSSRAQKLQAISDEFFSHGNFTQVDTKKLIDKVHEYGLISDKEFDSLSNSPLFKKAEKNTNNAEPKSLIEHLQDVKKAVDKSDSAENKELSIGLDKAMSILSDVEKAKNSPTFKQDITNAMSELDKLMKSDSFKKLDEKYQEAIEGSVAALEVIDKISPNRLSNPFINRYLDFSK